MSWNRKYRPQKIADLHLTSVRDNLQSLINQKNIPQVFLFAGPKGTGKTSSSRILGAVLNWYKNAEIVEKIFEKKINGSDIAGNITDDYSLEDNPKKDTDQKAFIQKILKGNSFVVQEMDAASNRGIDNIRELKERIALPPQEGNMTVYILDEAHMLTTEAFPSLLKVLEEPPAHVIFILATTELHKIPETIVSRCHVVTFTKASTKEIIDSLDKILTLEKIVADKEALQIIAEHADGSFRDGIKLLEMLTKNGKLTLESVTTGLAATSKAQFIELITAITSKDAESVVTLFQSLRMQGTNEKYFHTQLVSLLHQTLLSHHGIGSAPFTLSEAATIFLLKEFVSSDLSSMSIIPLLQLELASLEIISRAKQQKSAKKVQSKAELMGQVPTITLPIAYSDQDSNTTPTKKEIKSRQTIEKELITSQPVSVATDSSLPQGDAQKIYSDWHGFVDEVSKDNSTIGALLRSARPLSAQKHTLVVGVYYTFHKEQLSEHKFLTKIQDTVTEFTGGVIEFIFELVSPPQVAELHNPSSEVKDLAQLASESLM